MTSARPSSRLVSLDVFRGLTIALMILVNSPGNGTAYAPLEHAEWNGWTPTDLVFPFFVFIVGVSLVFSFAKRRTAGAPTGELVRQIVKRTAIIFGIGLLLNGFPYNHLASIRIPGVLQRIALCYFFASLLFLALKPRGLAAAALALLAGYWILLTRVPVPGFGPGELTREGCLPGYIDRIFFTGHMYTPNFDPEGILSTLGAVATALIGVLTGFVLLETPDAAADEALAAARQRKALGLFGAGLIGLAAGFVWDHWLPINKNLWTPSYVLFTGGAALAGLALCYWLIEVRDVRRWSKPFEIFGVNALIAYAVSIFDLKIQNRIPATLPDGTLGNLRLFITAHLFEPWASPMMSSFLYAASHTLIWLGILTILYRKKIFIKV